MDWIDQYHEEVLLRRSNPRGDEDGEQYHQLPAGGPPGLPGDHHEQQRGEECGGTLYALGDGTLHQWNDTHNG